MNCNKIIYNKYCNTIVQDEEFDDLFVYLYILQLNKSNGTTISLTFTKEKKSEQIIFDIRLDGFYTLVTVKVPLDLTMPYHYYKEKFYKGEEEVQNVLELVDVNPEYSKLDIKYDYYFLNCKLRLCYINLCLQIFNKRALVSCDNNCIDKNLIYKRDLVWAALNVLDYLVEMDLYEEAERLLERISGCNGLCSNNDNDNNNGCGCGK